MKADCILLLLCLLRYGYEKKPIQYAFLRAWLEANPDIIPEQFRTVEQVVNWMDIAISYAQSNEARSARQSREAIQTQLLANLREFASRFA